MIATNNRHGENSPYFDGWKAYNRNPFHLTQNPEGVIQMGLAENQVRRIFSTPSFLLSVMSPQMRTKHLVFFFFLALL